MIANITIGLMGKVYNRKCETVPFEDREAADEFQAKYGGLIRNLREIGEKKEEWDPDEWYDFDELDYVCDTIDGVRGYWYEEK
jgi:nitrous oxide reductase accessory protein NosL